ncbi:hypothetical protein ACFQJD_01300 [Haloplanus sp. GCM10025708]|uniref:hypothetical protein n=1 Tax=Haloplanus sp. GCM10025708 TaxID=3252679 RepID=UPI0036102372
MRPTPRCSNIADFLDDNDRQNHLRALARAFASALWARARARPRRTPIQHRAPTRPERAASAFPVRRDATTSVAVGFAEVRRTRTGEALAPRAHAF